MRRWPAFSLIEISIVLFIAGILILQIPPLVNFYKSLETKQQIDLAIKSLGAHVAQNLPLPIPENLKTDMDADILRGTLPYKTLGMKRKGAVIQYAVDRALTESNSVLKTNFCNAFPNHFPIAAGLHEKDLVAFELSAGKTKIFITRNNFSAQYCETVCKAF